MAGKAATNRLPKVCEPGAPRTRAEMAATKLSVGLSDGGRSLEYLPPVA